MASKNDEIWFVKHLFFESLAKLMSISPTIISHRNVSFILGLYFGTKE